ncbi:nudix hydrolase 10-like [Solanum tuberosum]|uniref:nudix hydrolase 10-like n=1 Tax=Solanum tuberosum TaxID=4113 RepID=UPI00073A1EBC|nr:PREDICTED: nudix hydrolase 10-like [Solanum tuberosum]
MEENRQVFEADEDAYGGTNVHIKESMDSIKFIAMLRASISQWTNQEGFWYHHAEAKYLMLVYWITQTPHTIPANGSHRVSIGAVINDNGEVLVIQEKNGTFKGTGVWKLSTGVVDEWMAIEEYAAQPYIKKHEIFNKIAEICLAKKENKYNGFSKVLMTSAFSTKRTYLYYNQN